MYIAAREMPVQRQTPGVVLLCGDQLTVEQVALVARQRVRVEITPAAIERVRAARDVVDHVFTRGDVVYGLNTGLGPLAHYRLSPENREEFMIRTVVGHVAVHGESLATETVRAMMLTRASGITTGGVGLRVEVLRLLVDMLNAGVHPLVRHSGSVGQGDLSEMAQIAQVLIGLGEAEYQGHRLPGKEALALAGIDPIRLEPKEALGLISANGLTVGRGSLVLVDLADILSSFDVAAALALEGFGANLSIIHPDAARLKPHPGHCRTADRLRGLLAGSYLHDAEAARNLQDPLSFRCIPHIHGACQDAASYVRRVLEVELNSAADNPLVSIDDRAIFSVGNFDVTTVAVAFDMVRLALAHVVHIANERIHKQLWAQFSDLPTGLGAIGDGISMLNPIARSCAALAAEAQHLANPVSLLYRAQLAEGVEDHASMAPLAVRRTDDLLCVAQRIIALELVVSARAIELRDCRPLGRGSRVAYEMTRACAPPGVGAWEPDIERVVAAVSAGQLARLVADMAPSDAADTTLGRSFGDIATVPAGPAGPVALA